MMSRLELQFFLIASRARLRPEDVGLPATTRRRVPGLRREEVAELVGVSPHWYAAFENGTSDRKVSPGFVERVADALRLNQSERVRLFRLALPEVAAVADHFEIILASTEESAREAQVAAGRALARNICERLITDESLREVRATGGRALALAICRHLAERDLP
ncbi:MAG: helix-turn-helix transcriptional regulator [Candidatus Velthaea sp.]|jgi:transcriptional regulator with XRE-family HTH domain